MTEHTYQLATRLRAIAADSLHTFQPGRRALTVEDLPEEIFVTARFATHPWGISGQLWARNSAAVLLASAEATAPDAQPSSITSRIRHFRSGNLLWTSTVASLPVTVTTCANCYTAVGRHCYQLHAQPRLDAHPIWHLTTDELDTEHPLFAGVVSAVTYIDGTFEHQPVRGRQRRAASKPADTHPWRHTDLTR